MKTIALVALGLFICVAGEEDSRYRDLRRCSGYCKESTKFKYQPGYTYLYDYRVNTSTGIRETTKEESRLHLSAVAEIAVLSACDFRLQLRDVLLEDSLPEDVEQHTPVPRMAELIEAVERHPLLFSFQNGRIEELCPSSDDSPWVLNIKRGVLSAFQNSMNSLEDQETVVYEKDVMGLCETTYSASSTKFSTSIVKTKDLLSCTHRLDHYLSFPSTPYNSPINIHSLPLLKSQYNCKQNIGATGLLESVVCNEVHVFRPFSNGQNGATTTVSQSLIYKKVVSHIQPEQSGPPGPRTTLLFQHNDEGLELPNQEQMVMRILDELGMKTKDGIEEEVPRLFSQLVTALKTLRYPQLSTLFSNTQQSPLRRFLLDAMSLVGTPDGVTVMIDLYGSQEVSDADLDSWLTSLAFQKKPSISMLAAVSTLLDKTPRPKAVLTASSLVHSFCLTQKTCNNKVVKEIIQKIEDLLGDNCAPKDEKHMELIIVALKGIGNAGIITNSMKTLRKCYEMDNPMEIRLAAIEAHRRLPCDVAPRDHFLFSFMDTQHKRSTEIRIAAYLELMKCPNLKTLQDIKEMLYKEEVNQVASFVWTHLTNLQETSSRWKQGIKALISNEFLKNKFNTDVRKYSRNYEASKYFESLNAGAGVESNIIFTPESYLPRSATLNLTLDLFGESFNVLEIGGRAEGFENTIENMFGSGGYFPDDTVKKFLENYREKNANDIDSSIDKLSIAFDAKGRRIQEPKASVYARIFGNELMYRRFNNLEKMLGNQEDNTYKDYMIKLALGEGMEYMKSFSLLDASYILPTMAGLPLEFAVNGSAAVGLKYSGLMTVKEISKGALSVSGELLPSAAVEITGTMSVRAFSARAGITSVNRLNTNTYIGGAVKIVHGKVADIKINVPRDKMEILDVSTKLFMIHKEAQHEIEGIMAGREMQEGCSPDVISDILGMKICGELSYPNASHIESAPHFPLTGPSTLHFSLLKTDTFSFYEFGYKFNPDPNISSLNIHFDTVGSQIDRKIQFLGVYDRKKSSVSVNLRSPCFKLVTSGRITNTPNVKGIDASLSIDNVNLFEIHAGLETTKRNNIGVYKPSFTLIYKDKSYLDVSGNVHYVKGVKYSVSLKIKSQYKPIFIRGDLKVQSRTYSFNANINSSFINGNVEGAVRQVSDYVGSHARIQYSLLEGTEQYIEITNKLLLSRKGDAELRSLQSSAKFSEFPGYDFDVNWELQRGYRLFSHSLSWTFGGSTWKTSQVYRNRILDQHIDFQLLGLLSCEQNGVDYKLDIKHQTTDISIISHAMAHLGTNHKYIASFDYFQNDGDKRTVAMELSYSGFNATVNGRLEQATPSMYDMFLEASLLMKSANHKKQKLHNLKLGGRYTDQSYGELQNHVFHMELTGDLNAEFSGALQASETSIKQWLQLSACDQIFREDVNYTYDGLHNVDVGVQLIDRYYKGKFIITNTDNAKGVVVNLDLSTKLTFSAELINHEKEDFLTFGSELTWNQKRYPKNRIYLMAQSSGPMKNFSLEYPGQKINGELIILPDSIETQLQWHPTKKISTIMKWLWAPEEANLFGKLETPWRGLEKQIFSAEYKAGGQNAQLQVQTMWQNEKLAFLAHGERSMINDGVWFSETKLNMTSTIKNWENLNINMNYTHGQHIESNIEFNNGNQYSSMTIKYKAGVSRITAGFSLTSPWFQNSISGKLMYKIDDQSYSGSIGLNWAHHKEISGDFVFSTNSQSHLKLTTPFKGYETFIVELLFKTNSPTLRIFSKISINDHLSLFSLDKSISKTYGKLVTPFTYPLELTIEQGKMQDLMLLQHNGKEIMKYRKTGGFFINNKLEIIFEMNLPQYTVYLHANNVVENRKSLLQLDGKLNSKTLSVLLSRSSTEQFHEFEMFYNAKISGSIILTPIEMNFHQLINPGAYCIDLQLPGGINMTNNFFCENFFQWTNTFNINTPWKSGRIFNFQDYNIEESVFHHQMTADINGQESRLEVWLEQDLGSVSEAKGELSTPWSDPVTIHFSKMKDGDVNKARLTMSHEQKNVNLVVTHAIEPLKTFVTIQLESPYNEDISLTTVYDAASSSKSVFMKTEWARKTLELDSHLRFDQKDGFLRLVVKGFETEQEILNCMLNYDLRYENKFIDLNGAFGGNEIHGKFNQLVGLYEFNMSLKTVFKGWENVQILSNVKMNKFDKIATVKIMRNNDIVNVTSLSKWDTNFYIVSINAENTFSNLPNVSLDGTYDRRSSNNQVVSIVYNHNGTVTELHSKLDHDTKNFVDAGALEITLKTPIKTLQFLKALISYNNKNENNQQMKFLLARDEWKLQIDGESVFDNMSSQASLKLLLPFQDVQTLSASLNHKHLSNREQTLNILISCNNKNVEIGGHVISYGNELLASMEIKTPIAGYENISGDFNLEGIIRKKKSFLLNLVVQHHSLLLSGDLTIASPLQVDGSLNAQFPKNQKVSAGLSYDLLGTNNTRRHANFYLIFPQSKYQLTATFDRQTNGNIVAKVSINSPILDSQTTGSYEADARTFKTNFTLVRDQKNPMVRADLNIQPDFFSLNWISPAIGYEKLFVEGKLDWKSYKKSMNLLFVENRTEYKMSLLMIENSGTIETKIDIYTPIVDWQVVNIHGLYNFSSNMEEEIKLVAVKGEQSLDVVGKLYYNGQDILSSLYVLQTSLGTLGLTANFTSEGSSIRVRGIDNNGRKTLENVIRLSNSNIQFLMHSTFPQLQNINLTVAHSAVPKKGFINTELQYQGIGSINSTLTWKLEISNDRIYLAMDPFVLDSSIRNVTSTLKLKNLFTNLSDAGLSFQTSANGSNILELLLDFNNDWENKLGTNFKILILDKNVLNICAWGTPKFPPKELHLTVSDQSITLVNISNVVSVNNDGFTYEGHLILPNNKKSLLIEYYPDATFVHTSFNISYDDIKQEFKALIMINKENELNIRIITPILGYEEFSLTSTYAPDFIVASLKTPFTSSFSGELKLLEQNKKQFTFSIIRNDSVLGMDMVIQYETNFMNISFDVTTPLQGLEKLSLNSFSDFQSSKKIYFAEININEDMYTLKSEFLFGNLSARSVLNISTPISKFQKSTFILQYDLLSSISKTLVIQGEINRLKYLDVNVELIRHGKKGRVYFNTQLPVNDISFTYDFSDPSKRSAVKTNMNIFGAKFSGKMNYNWKEGQDNNGKLEAFLIKPDSTQWSTDMNFKIDKRGAAFVWNVKASIIELKVKLDRDSHNRMSSNIDIILYGRKLVTCESSLAHVSAGYLKSFSLTLETYFEDFKLYSFMTREEGLTLTSGIEWGKKLKTGLTGSFHFLPHNIHNEISVIRTNSEPLTVSFDCNFTTPKQSFDFILDYGFKALQIKGIYSNGKLNVTAETPFHGYSHLQLNVQHTQNSMLVRYQHEKYLTQFVAQLTKTDFILSLITPLEILKEFTLNGRFVNPAEMSTFIRLLWGSEKYLMGLIDFSPKYSRLHLNTTLQNSKELEIYFYVTENHVTSKFELFVGCGNDKINTTASFNHNNQNLEIDFQVPWAENIKIKGSRDRKERGIVFVCQYGVQNTVLETKFTHDVEKNNLHLYDFQAVFFKTWELNMHVVTSPTFAEIMISQESGTVSGRFSLEITKNKERLLGVFSLETPFKNFEQIDIYAELNFFKKYALCMLHKNKELYKVESSINQTDNSLEGKFSIESPHFSMTDASLLVSYDEASLHVSIEALKQKIDVQSSFDINELNLILNVILETPLLKSLDKTSLSINANAKNLTNSLQAFWMSNSVSLTANLNPKNFVINLQTPFKILENFHLCGKLVSTATSHDFMGSLSWPPVMLTLNTSARLELNDYSAYSVIEWAHSKNMTVGGYLHFPSLQDLKLNLNSSLSQPFEGTVDYYATFQLEKVAYSEYKFNVKIFAPVVGNMLSSVVYSFNKNGTFYLNSQTSLFDDFQFSIRAAVNADDPKYTYGNLLIKASHKIFPEIGLHGEIDKVRNAADFQIKISETVYKFSTSCLLLEDNITMALKLQLPRIIYLEGSIKHGPQKAEVFVIVNDNHFSSSYEIQQSFLYSQLDLSLPVLSIQEAALHIAANYSDSISNGSITCKYQEHQSRIMFILRKNQISSHNNKKAVPSNLYPFHLSVLAHYYSGESSRNASLIIENDDTQFSVVGKFISHQSLLTFRKSDGYMNLVLGDWVNVEHLSKSDGGFIIFSWPTQVHKLKYHKELNKGFKAIVEIESSFLIGGKRDTQLVIENINSKVQGTFITKSGSLEHSIIVDMDFGNQKLVKMSLLLAKSSPFDLEVSLSTEKDKFSVNAECSFDGLRTSISFTHKTFPFNSRVRIESPFSDPLEVMLLIAGEPSLASIHYGKHFVLETMFHPLLGKAHFLLKTPTLLAFELGGEFIANAHEIKLITSLTLNKPSIEASLKFHFTDNSFDSHFKLLTSMRYHEHYEGYVYIPFNFTPNTHLNCSLILPYTKYAYSGAVRQQGEMIEFISLNQHREKLVNLTFKLEYDTRFVIFAEINTPFPGFTHYCLDLKGQKNLKDGNDIVNYLEWGQKKIELRYSFIIELNKFMTQVQLRTPFENYNLYAMRIQFENHARKVAIATLTYPGLDSPIGIEFDYLYKSLFDINLIAQFNIPFFPRFQKASFLLGNKLNLAEGSYQAIISGLINEKKLSLNIDGLMNSEVAKLEIQAQQNDKEICLRALSAYDDVLYQLTALFELQTPLPVIKSTKFSLTYGPSLLQIVSSYNLREMLALNISATHSLLNFELRNPIRPVSFRLGKIIQDKMVLFAEICWDMNNRFESQLTLEYTLLLSWRKQEIKSKLQFPTRTIYYDFTHEFLNNNSLTYQESALHFSWEDGKTIGYHFLSHQSFTNYTIFGRLDFPFRSFAGSYQSLTGKLEYKKGEFLWDAADNINKRIGLELSTVGPTVKYSFYAHDALFEIIQNYRKSYSTFPFATQVYFAYSAYPEDIFSLRMMHEYHDSLTAGLSVHHRPSFLHFDSTLELWNHDEVTKSKLNITYMKPSIEQRINLVYFGKFAIHKPEVEIQFLTNENSIDMGGLMWSREGGYHGISLYCQMNQKEPIILSTAMSSDKTAIEVESRYGKQRRFTLSGHFPNWQEISAQASHSLNEVITQDGFIALKLNTSHLFWSRAEWSPQILEDIKPDILQEYTDITYVVKAIGQSYLQLLNEEFQISFPDITMNGILDYTKSEIRDIRQDFQAIMYDVFAMYEKNDFFLKDICHILKSSSSQLYSFLAAMGKSVTDVVETVVSFVKDLFAFLWDALSVDYLLECASHFITKIQGMMSLVAEQLKLLANSLNHVKELLRDFGKQMVIHLRMELLKLRKNLHQIAQDISLIVMDYLNLLGMYVEKCIDNFEHYISYIQVEAMVIVLEAADVIEDITVTFLEIPEVQYLIETYARYASWLEEFHLQDHIDDFITAIAEAVDLLVNDVMKAVNHIKTLLLGSTQPYLNTVDQMPMMLCIKTAINEMYQKIVWFWNYYKITNQILNGLDSVLDRSDSMLLDAFNGMDSEEESKTNLIFRPEIGLAEYTQELPIEWNGFNEMPKFEQFSWNSVNKKPEKHMEKLDKYSYVFTNPLNTAVNKTLKALLPPFSKHAIIAGKHFITFDNKVYNFEGDCSYLLASDFSNNKFSVIINYEIKNRQVVKSLMVITEGHHILLGSNHRVSVNGTKTELPVLVCQSTWVTRSGERILVSTTFGMEIECNLHHDIYTITLAGWYFGKTGGLLGTFDNEPSNDLSLPDGTITSDINNFAHSWQVGNEARCRKRSEMAEYLQNVTSSGKDLQICSSYFQHSSSLLSSCFASIDPQPYYNMCLQDGGCLTAATYVTQCKKIDIDVLLPPECVNCSLPSGFKLNAGESKVFPNGTVQSADVVLVVEQASCLQSVRLTDAVTKLDNALKAKGISDAHYSVVGFGGENFVQPHTRTANGEVWTTRKLIDKSLNSLQFEVENSNDDVSVYDALWYAARLSFRAGVSKTIVLIQCNACNDQVQTNDYSDMLRLLQDNGITLHILQPDVVKFDASPEKTAKLFGMDIEGTYSARNLANLTPKKNLLRQVTLPKDLCVPLALETNGTTFNLNHMFGEKTHGTSKRFLDVWSRRLTKDTFLADTQKCQCVADQDLVGRMMCATYKVSIHDSILQDFETSWLDDDTDYDL